MDDFGSCVAIFLKYSNCVQMVTDPKIKSGLILV